MDLTSERKARIDAMSYEQLLEQWRHAPVGSPWFQDGTGDYWSERMRQLREVDPAEHVRASKSIGWGGN